MIGCMNDVAYDTCLPSDPEVQGSFPIGDVLCP